ncbi:unnamed protein product [Timema podura]|uniref:Menorin-like domain-containing protein n=1 Tax=Timema podura TaxID=61482 RepID=A0ABN7PE23_TIMPD|nr:unnamed protein product [Timema podura]
MTPRLDITGVTQRWATIFSNEATGVADEELHSPEHEISSYSRHMSGKSLFYYESWQIEARHTFMAILPLATASDEEAGAQIPVGCISLLFRADKLMMLEADVVLGNKIGSTEEIPIMAHPPSTTSEMSLEDFLSNAIIANSCGVKLDFKSIEVLEPSLKILQNHKDNLTFPVWLNADILSGPVNSTALPVDADKFLSICARDFPLATLSPGWKVRYGAPNITSGRYEPEHITSMKEALARNNIIQPLTFPVQAILAAQSIDTLPDLLNMSRINDTTLTIWLSEVEAINITQLKKLIDIVGKNRVYLDLPESIMDQLSSSTSRVAPTTSMGLVVGVVLVAAASYFF